LLFLDENNNKKHCTIYLHLTIIGHRLSTQPKKIQNAKKKINQSARGPQINQQRSPNIFGIF
jgi:hypothetical protein